MHHPSSSSILPTVWRNPVGSTLLRKHYLPLKLLRAASLAPGLCGFLYNLKCIFATGMLTYKISSVEYIVAGLWCLLTAALNFRLVEAVMGRWLYKDEMPRIVRKTILLYIALWGITAYVASKHAATEPIWTWVLISFLSAFALVIEWYISSRAKSQIFNQPPASLKTLLWAVLPTIALLSMLSLVLLLHVNSNIRYTVPEKLPEPAFHGNRNVSSSEYNKNAQVRMVVVIISSWSQRSFEKRKVFRETTLKLVPRNSHRVSTLYRFVIGQPPNSAVHQQMTSAIEQEMKEYNDLLILPSSDLYEDLSKKSYSALEWANKVDFDYFVKTDDDIFVRFDTLWEELQEQPLQEWYWSGLAYHDIPPIKDLSNKNSATDYNLGRFPPYVAGALYVLSKDLVTRIVSDGPRLYTKNEDQNLGLWLYPYNIQPKHDRRIQQNDVCEDDMIAKHFSDAFKVTPDMYAMYDNVIKGRRLCEGFKQYFCAMCYPCTGRATTWQSWGFTCDRVRGISLANQPDPLKIEDSKRELFEDPNTMNSDVKETWIIPDLLSTKTSIYSDTPDWSLLHWVIWTTPPATFQDRHFKCLELVFVHNPKAVIFVLSNTLPQRFFDQYRSNGYQIHIVEFSMDLVLSRGWYFGPNSEGWVKTWNKPDDMTPIRQSDYLRAVCLYKYGGMYMDMDALWLQSVENSQMEFVGSDLSKVQSDNEWTLDDNGKYLANGVMRFRRGRIMFREMMESVFRDEIPKDCYNCLGPKALTSYVRNNRYLETNGLNILDREVLYPVGYLAVSKMFKADPNANQQIRDWFDKTWSLHLFGKMTNILPINANSVVDIIFQNFTLKTTEKLPHVELMGPSELNISKPPKTGVPFHGINVIFLRGGANSAKNFNLKISVNYGTLSWGPDLPRWLSNSIDVHNVNQAQINQLLSTITYHPPPSISIAPTHDVIQMDVTFDDVQLHKQIVANVVA
ncbi:hypothetical protein K493DRAFT_332421 [Basidiobolus meristosporus CBS 931.73]|uniref:Alpha 1,4-glycosyltransferase domain-containing protein n=1 Tax=Basidiobolus meristosporus CBS 931.73 TaxID=1314790 RepID=A0A1Y1ZDH0_9FUNG|nr:hypothetical protein K493DRAFT_332421 [Basidiobolus meristosporus CBS 931.73]|eukprot:ORY08291.1 hypothetical protein K493DRAFT_332421 [Basidiobolus meristosporus CBS 931.73]